MDTSLSDNKTASPKVVELLSRILGKNLRPQDITHPIVFLSALIIILLGIIYADSVVADEEKRRFKKTINHFIPAESNIRHLVQPLSKGIQEQKLYTRLDDLLALVASLSASEKLLLVGFGYDMSASDGSIDKREKKYLHLIAHHLGVRLSYLEVFEAGITGQKASELTTLEEVRCLLAPTRFRELDTIFMSAASELLEALPKSSEAVRVYPNHRSTSYTQLKEFQVFRKQLDGLCYKLYQIIQEGINQELLSNTLIANIGKLSQKLQSQKFRIVVLGEFSQGKSTLLNALLGEKIQPTRAIPCSSTVSVLKYGSSKRVICHYKDGRQEEVPLEQYIQKVEIPKEVAKGGSFSEVLGQSEIREVVFEHPELELCRNGVEIIDCPGLNEHPDRAAITHQVLKEVDAVIFLASAIRPLSQSERELLQGVRIQLSRDKLEQPVQNIFIAVNFIDLLDEEEDRQDVKQRFENFLRGKKPLLDGENRIHYISAKAALDAVLKKQENEYLDSFLGFTQAIEHFLVSERGCFEIKQFSKNLKDLIQDCQFELNIAENNLDEKSPLHSKKIELLEQIGELGGREVKLRLLVDALVDEVIENTEELWDDWAEELGERLAEKSAEWRSSHSIVFSQDKVKQDYVDQFFKDLTSELDNLQDNYLNPPLEEAVETLNQAIKKELSTIKFQVGGIDKRVGMRASKLIDSKVQGVESKVFIGNLAYLAVPAFMFLPGIILPVVVGAGIGILKEFFDSNQETKLKQQVYDLSWDKFLESVDTILEEIGKNIISAINELFEPAIETIGQVIESCELTIEQHEQSIQESREEILAHKTWINQQLYELEQIQKSVDTILDGLTE